MFLVEWCYGVNSQIRERVCQSRDELVAWVDTLNANGAAFIAVSLVGAC